jgi:uncharacterized protein YcbK (DUF882 family)
MRAKALPLVALLGLLCSSGTVLLAFARSAPAASKTPAPKALIAAAPRRAEPVVGAATSAFAALPLVHIENQTSRDVTELRLYDASGRIDENAATRLDEVLCDARDPKHRETGRMDRRTLQLLFKAAYHFGSHDVQVVSGYRKPGKRREGPHGTGAAVDFRLRGVKASELAAYLRDQPRTGVGIYTHPKTQYVHLDVREHSFHWLDASPPRRRWREKSIGSRDLPAKDATYSPTLDLPEGLPSPLLAPNQARSER